MCNTVDKQIANLQSQLDELKALREQEMEDVVNYPSNRKRPSKGYRHYYLNRENDSFVLDPATTVGDYIDMNKYTSGVMFNNREQGAAHLHVLNTIMKNPEWLYWFPGMEKPKEHIIREVQWLNGYGDWCNNVSPREWGETYKVAIHRYKYREE